MARRIIQESTAFEKAVATTCAAYEAAGLATLEKCEPPTRSFSIPGKGRRESRTVFLPNPFLDFTGSWTEWGGKRLEIECKHTSEPILHIGSVNDKTGLITKSAGIKWTQYQSALRWTRAGAACAFLWRYQNRTKLVTPAMIAAQLQHRKSFRWVDAHEVPQGSGFILIDFLALLRRIHKPSQPKPQP